MNQIAALKTLLQDYVNCGGSPDDLDGAVVYIQTRKPAGVGHVNAAILRSVLKETKLILPGPPVPKVEEKPAFIPGFISKLKFWKKVG